MKKLLLILLIATSCTTVQKTPPHDRKNGAKSGKHGKKQNKNNGSYTPDSDASAGTTGTGNANYELPTTGELKKPIKGLICRDFDRVDAVNGSDDEMMKITNGVVIQLYWKDIQPQENGPIVRNNKVDNAIAWVRKFKAKYGVDIPIKIRLYSGIDSPDWLINKSNFMLKEQKTPKYWEPIFIAAYADVQRKLAELYDNVPEISEIENGGAGVRTAENFIRPYGLQGKKAELNQIFLNAGLTREKDSIAIVKSDDAMKPWKKTLISVCYSSFQYLDKNGNAYESASLTIPFIDMFLQKFGKQAVIGNNGLRTNAGHNGDDFEEGGERYKLYTYFKMLHDTKGITVYFQTSTTERSGSTLSPVIREGIKYGASYIELPTNPRQYRTLLGNDLEPLNKEIKAVK